MDFGSIIQFGAIILVMKNVDFNDDDTFQMAIQACIVVAVALATILFIVKNKVNARSRFFSYPNSIQEIFDVIPFWFNPLDWGQERPGKDYCCPCQAAIPRNYGRGASWDDCLSTWLGCSSARGQAAPDWRSYQWLYLLYVGFLSGCLMYCHIGQRKSHEQLQALHNCNHIVARDRLSRFLWRSYCCWNPGHHCSPSYLRGLGTDNTSCCLLVSQPYSTAKFGCYGPYVWSPRWRQASPSLDWYARWLLCQLSWCFYPILLIEQRRALFQASSAVTRLTRTLRVCGGKLGFQDYSC